MSIDPAEVALNVLKQQEQNREALRVLVDEQLSHGYRHVVTRAPMGHTVAYLGSVTLEWFATRVRFASSLPLFEHKIDPVTKKIVIDHDTIQEISQRNPDWSRQSAITQYLVTRPNHKFPPVLAVISQPWVDNPNAADWGPDGRAMRATAGFTSLDSEGKIGVLEIPDSATIYALDGQHRLMGAKGLVELMNSGSLTRWTKDHKEAGTITLNELGVDASSIQAVASERIGIELIAAVNEGELRETARQRVRGIFVHVNMMAAQLSKGEIALLNEDDGFAIIAKKAALEHPLLKHKEGADDRLQWERATLTKNSKEFTTLETLKEAAHDYLGFVEPYANWRSREKGLVPIRPEEDELEAGTDAFFEFLTNLSSLPSVQEMVNGSSPKDLRPPLSEGGSGSGIMRPVLQRAVALAAGALVFEKKISAAAVFSRLIQLDSNNGLVISEPASPFYGVLWELSGKVREAGRVMAADILRFMLGGGFPEQEARELLQAQLSIRRTHPVTETVIGWDGQPLPQGQMISLPQVY